MLGEDGPTIEVLHEGSTRPVRGYFGRGVGDMLRWNDTAGRAMTKPAYWREV